MTVSDPDLVATLRRRYAAVADQVAAAARAAGREDTAVRILPVSKTHPVEVLAAAQAAGLTLFAENTAQEALRKAEALPDAHWAMIGRVQRNKAKYVARFATECHSLDSVALAEELNRRLEREGRELDVFIQVNTSGEEQKAGIAPQQLDDLVTAVEACPHLRPRGLMTMALRSEDEHAVRGCFALLRQLRDELVLRYPAYRELSMGMSGDYLLAIAEGATTVRIGRALFGSRS